MKDHVLQDSVYTKRPIQADLQRQHRLVAAQDCGVEVSEMGVATNAYRVSFWGDENILKLIVVMAAQFSTYLKLLNCLL